MNPKPKYIQKIEQLEIIKKVAFVLKELENNGISQACVASGFTRSFLAKTPQSDIDIAYYSDVDYKKAREIFTKIIKNHNLTNLDWDFTIYNVKQMNQLYNSVEDMYLALFVNSIDTVYLNSRGHLIDPTGYGFNDSINRILRMNNYLTNGYDYTDSSIVYVCIEGCRRIYKFNWKPTEESIKLIKYGAKYWDKLSNSDKSYFLNKRIKSKFNTSEYEKASKIYQEFGWGFLFDLAKGI